MMLFIECIDLLSEMFDNNIASNLKIGGEFTVGNRKRLLDDAPSLHLFRMGECDIHLVNLML